MSKLPQRFKSLLKHQPTNAGAQSLLKEQPINAGAPAAVEEPLYQYENDGIGGGLGFIPVVILNKHVDDTVKAVQLFFVDLVNADSSYNNKVIFIANTMKEVATSFRLMLITIEPVSTDDYNYHKFSTLGLADILLKHMENSHRLKLTEAGKTDDAIRSAWRRLSDRIIKCIIMIEHYDYVCQIRQLMPNPNAIVDEISLVNFNKIQSIFKYNGVFIIDCGVEEKQPIKKAKLASLLSSSSSAAAAANKAPPPPSSSSSSSAAPAALNKAPPSSSSSSSAGAALNKAPPPPSSSSAAASANRASSSSSRASSSSSSSAAAAAAATNKAAAPAPAQPAQKVYMHVNSLIFDWEEAIDDIVNDELLMDGIWDHLKVRMKVTSKKPDAPKRYIKKSDVISYLKEKFYEIGTNELDDDDFLEKDK